MKKYIIISVLSLFLALAWGGYIFAQTENPAGDMKAMAVNPTPGLYVNSWPAFTLSYPKDWEVQRLVSFTNEVFRVGENRGAGMPPSPVVVVSVHPNPFPLDKLTSVLISKLEQIGKDIKVISDKPVQLKDGTPAQEVELEWVVIEHFDVTLETKLNSIHLTTTKDDVWISLSIIHDRGKIGEDVKSILYSLKLQPGKEELVKVPPDVEQFFKEFGGDVANHDVKKVMTHYSNRYLNYGGDKQHQEDVWWQIFSVIAPNSTFYEVSVTGFELQGDKAYVTGFTTDNYGKHSIGSPAVMIKEEGQWKWYGNQVEAAIGKSGVISP